MVRFLTKRVFKPQGIHQPTFVFNHQLKAHYVTVKKNNRIPQDNNYTGNALPRKRKMKWNTSYSNMTFEATEKRLNLRLKAIDTIPPRKMLSSIINPKDTDILQNLKELVYTQLVDTIDAFGYHAPADTTLTVSSVNRIACSVIVPVIVKFKSATGCKVEVISEKTIVAPDGETGGSEEFVVVDLIEVQEDRYVCVMESKRDNIGFAIQQCLLAMKDMRDCNGGGAIYGFVTSGELWQMLKYDGKSFQLSELMILTFPTMGDYKEKWMNENSLLVECMFAALHDGGIANANM